MKEAIRSFIRDALGLEIVRSDWVHNFSQHLHRLLNKTNFDTVIDVGANAGQFGKLLRRLGFYGEIHSFEPVPLTFDQLKQCTKDDARWFCHNVALGNADGEGLIRVTAASDFSSFLKPNEYGVGRWPGMEEVLTEIVPVRRLDHYAQKLNIAGRRTLLKLDTQGYDLEVFRGAIGILDRVEAIVTELAFQPIYEQMPGWRDALAEYERFGFHLSGMYPLHLDANLALIEADCILVQREVI